MRFGMMTRGLALGACCLVGTSSMTAGAQSMQGMDMSAHSEAGSPAKALDTLLSLYEGDDISIDRKSTRLNSSH